MTVPKKAAKKAAKLHVAKDESAKDLRRAYEHLGRVQVLCPLVSGDAAQQVATLSQLAQQQLAAGFAKDAADLLRASEHISFGAQPVTGTAGDMDAQLKDSIHKEFRQKLERAEEHWSEQQFGETLGQVYDRVRAQASAAFDAGAFRQALELARAAEALAHVALHPAKQLAGDKTQSRLNA